MVDYGRAVPHSAWLRDKPQRSGEFSTAPSGENTSATDTAGRLPDLDVLRRRFAPDPAALPAVTVRLAPLADYDTLLTGEAA